MELLISVVCGREGSSFWVERETALLLYTSYWDACVKEIIAGGEHIFSNLASLKINKIIL
jgi:hypothetical protein